MGKRDFIVSILTYKDAIVHLDAHYLFISLAFFNDVFLSFQSITTLLSTFISSFFQIIFDYNARFPV